MHWKYDPRSVANSVIRENTLAYTRLSPRRTPANRCKTRYACQWHDNKVFDDIDHGKLDPQDKHHQFLLGLRAIAGSIAEWETWIELLASLPREYYTVRPKAENEVKSRLGNVDPFLKAAQRILERWQNAYREQNWDSIYAFHMVAHSQLRCAATGIVDIGNDFGTLTLLPIVHNGELTNQYDIIGVTLKSSWKRPLTRLFQQGSIKKEVFTLKGMLEQQPSRALEWMAGELSHIAINPDDYQNKTLINSESKMKIEQAAASRIGTRHSA